LIAEKRKALLIDKLRKDGYVQATDFASDIKISAATIRRDLIQLEKEGYCIRKRGGAVRSTQSVTMELPYEIKKNRNTAEKRRIANRALDLIENGDTILMDAGSTIYSLACLLHTKEQLTVITNDLNIAVKLAANPKINLICTGGIARPNVYTLQGVQVVEFINDLRVDKSFIGADAIHKDGIISNVNIDEVPIKQAMIKAADTVALLTDSSKFSLTGFARVASICEMDFVVTDENMPEKYFKYCKDNKVQLVVA